MKKEGIVIAIMTAAMMLTSACGEKKKSENIITTKVVTKSPSAPQKMQEYDQVKEFEMSGNHLTCHIHRAPDDSLRMVKNEQGQKYYDNRITMEITREDGSVFVSKSFTKSSFDEFLDEDYRQTGVMAGLVFDKVEGGVLKLAASVAHPNTDEYIPLIVSIDKTGAMHIERDKSLDTNGEEEMN